MRLYQIFSAFGQMFSSYATRTESDRKRIRTNRNPHNFTRYEVAKDFFIDAVNIESATAQYNKIMAKKAMRLEKSNAKQLCAS